MQIQHLAKIRVLEIVRSYVNAPNSYGHGFPQVLVIFIAGQSLQNVGFHARRPGFLEIAFPCKILVVTF